MYICLRTGHGAGVSQHLQLPSQLWNCSSICIFENIPGESPDVAAEHGFDNKPYLANPIRTVGTYKLVIASQTFAAYNMPRDS